MLPVLTIRQTAVRTMRHERASHITPHTNVTHLWRQSFSRCGNHRSVHPTHSTIRHQQQNAHTSLAAPRHPRASTQSNADSDHSYLHPIVTSNGMPHRERRYAGGRPCGRPHGVSAPAVRHPIRGDDRMQVRVVRVRIAWGGRTWVSRRGERGVSALMLVANGTVGGMHTSVIAAS